MADDLSAPLTGRGRKPKRAPRGRGHLPIARLAFGLLALIIIGLVARILLVNDPLGGQPFAVSAINSTRNANKVAKALGTTTPVTITAGPEIPVAALTGTTTPAITQVSPDLPEGIPDSAGKQLNTEGVYPDLAEETKDGPIPRKSASGETPFTAYSTPTPAAAANGKAMIAIVVTGLGLNEAGTLDAVTTLPPEVTLAFAPYGNTLHHTVAAAHGAGHELMLEVPMEPFDYPDNDPGPKTLLTNQPARTNLNKLYWLMARFGGYVGLINHTGARFTASATDFAPIMEELGTRGLGYLDDGTSNRSLAPQLADKDNVPFARAAAVLDAVPDHADILKSLDALVARAESDGGAIGVASALPVSIRTIADWAQTLAGTNVALVPVSALMK